jgi:hypothetical protein
MLIANLLEFCGGASFSEKERGAGEKRERERERERNSRTRKVRALRHNMQGVTHHQVLTLHVTYNSTNSVPGLSCPSPRSVH